MTRFVPEAERNSICRILTELTGRSDLWAPVGAEKPAEPKSEDERVLHLCALSIFDGNRELRFAELTALDPSGLYAIGTLLASVAVDALKPSRFSHQNLRQWISDHRRLRANEQMREQLNSDEITPPRKTKDFRLLPVAV